MAKFPRCMGSLKKRAARRTWFASRTRPQAVAILLCSGLLLLWSLTAAPRSMLALRLYERQAPAPDLVIYQNVVRRVHGGDGYYAALANELRSHGFPTCSILNWRTPLHVTGIASLPSLTWARGLLMAGSVAATAMAIAVTFYEGSLPMALVQGAMMLGAFLVCFVPAGVYFADIWSGMFISISIQAYAFNRWQMAVGWGAIALFFRELALPYVLISLLIAWRRKHKAELMAWFAAMAAYTLYVLFHAHSVLSQLTTSEMCSPVGWLQFGGIDSVLRMSRVGWLLAMNPWATALYLCCALLGLAGWNSGVGRRVGLTVAVYLILFAAVGLPGNFYWGAIYAPLLAFGIAWSGPAMRDLLRVLSADEASRQ